jgi:Domain of Unknown Function with PDB structure (DUF3857)/Transglutaminase-like superfamily
MRNTFIFIILFFSNPAANAHSSPITHHSSLKKVGGPMAVGNIPASLMENADLVRRYRQMNYTIKSPRDIKLKVTEAVTILHAGLSERHRMVIAHYDKQVKLTDLTATVFDANGEVVKRYKSKDFDDVLPSGYQEMNIDDTRLKVLRPTIVNYPVTIEYSFTLDMNGMPDFTPWRIFDEYRMAVQRDELSIEAPTDYKFRIKTIGNVPAPTTREEGGSIMHQWTMTNVQPIVEEPFEPDMEERSPAVLFAPDQIYHYGVEGDVSSWKAIGAWSYKLLENRDKLPAATIEAAKKMTASASSTREKAAILYKYMQSRTRYVSVQLGIGGYQPFPAEQVDGSGYGDCKALSNYMRALLAAVNIPSYYAIVGAGDDRRIRYPDFPNKSQSNHIILCVPDVAHRDTIWLECTSQQMPFGFIGNFTGNRYAVIATPQGGFLVPTTRYRGADNEEVRQFDFTLLADGSATGKADIKAKGLRYDDWEPLLQYEGSKELADWIQRAFPVTDAIVNTHTAKANTTGKIPVMEFAADFKRTRLATPQAGRLFMSLIPLRHSDVPNPTAKRSAPIEVDSDILENDTWIYRLPEGYRADFLPDAKTIETPFGTYKRSAQQQNGVITVKRTYSLNMGQYPATQWSAFATFLQQVAKADAEKAILIE